MDEEFSSDPSQLLEAASDFAYQPADAMNSGALSDTSAQEFLTRFPLPAIISALQTNADYPGLENALVDCLERIFRTKYGASLIPHYMPFILVGLGANSQKVRRLACVAISCLLENTDKRIAVQLVLQHGVYPLLLSCLIDGDPSLFGVFALLFLQNGLTCQGADTAVSCAIAILSFEHGHVLPVPYLRTLCFSGACYDCASNIICNLVHVIELEKTKVNIFEGIIENCSTDDNSVTFLQGIVFPASVNEATHLGNLAAKCSSLGRVRVLALIVRLFSISSSVASEVSRSNLLSLLEAEVKNTNDTLVTLNVLELLYEITSGAAESILRSRAMMIAGRLLSKENAFAFIDESSVRTVLSAIDWRFEFMGQEADECECALEALGQIGSSFQGATILLATTPPTSRHVVDAAFDRQQHGKQLAALHSLGNIAGETRIENTMVLSSSAEENLRSLTYDKASRTSKLTPSGLLLSVLQQDSEIRIAEIIDIVTNTYTETTKIGMEARHRCCEAIYSVFSSSTKLLSDPSFADMASKLQEAIRRGPYGARKRTEAQPVVATADRF
ncbi:hypothetical protein DH2020_033445 [Rehmannia glutinosa]|uniref:ARM repeat superfamily protein n=1 Tax=Rehmannia glutinosa TaxID=99300 RepID=A0ABR0VD46_REHGL